MTSSHELDDYEQKVLNGWEEIYKRGLVTMWLLLAARDEPRYGAEIADFVAAHSKGTMAIDDRSLYRAMRRLHKVGLVDVTRQPGRRTGADRKYYVLTPSGRKILDAFLDRNIRRVYIDGDTELFA